MPVSDNTICWDIFCTVIDNYGDIGVCWRLARQLRAEHGFSIRLWVDELSSFKRICPKIQEHLPTQYSHGVEIRSWSGDFSQIRPADVVIEAFACHLPESFVEAMAARNPEPVWINLDYLSAEAWVSGCHALPSPHPRLSLCKYFFFPGFRADTGGLLREQDLEKRRQTFCASPTLQRDFWTKIGQTPPTSGTQLVSLFAYENQALTQILRIWQNSDTPVCCLAPITRTQAALEMFAGHTLQAGDVIQRGQLEIRLLPFVSQADYDLLLWLCDINFVRGEDSFVRAQWAAKPMLWHIYPQEDDAHQIKLNAFLDVYCTGLSSVTGKILRDVHSAWNCGNKTVPFTAALWQQWIAVLPELSRHAENWAKNQSKQEDLCSSLVRFCRSKL